MISSYTSIERKIDLNTPCYVYSTSKMGNLFNTTKFNLFIKFDEKHKVYKGEEMDASVPDFILLNKQEYGRVKEFEKQVETGNAYKISINNVIDATKPHYFIEAFGDFWHSEKIIGLNKEEHEKQVKEAYEFLGHKVLILWEHEINDNWEEMVYPLLKRFINDFSNTNEVPEEHEFDNDYVRLSNEAIKSLNDTEYWKNCQNKSEILDEIVSFYQKMEYPKINVFDMYYDFNRMKRIIHDNGVAHISKFGSVLPYYFSNKIYTDEYKLSRKDVWKDEKLMRKVLVEMFSQKSELNCYSLFENMCAKRKDELIYVTSPSEIILRLKDIKDGRNCFFDPFCGYGSSMIASYFLGYKKFIGVDIDSDKIEDLKKLAEFLNYDVELFVGDSSDKSLVKKISTNNNIDICFLSDDFCDADEFVIKARKIVAEELCTVCKVFVEDKHNKSTYYDNVHIVKENYWENKEADNCFYYAVHSINDERFVKCMECGYSFEALTNHFVKHNITADEYKLLYPGEETVSKYRREQIIQDNKNKFGGVKTTYDKSYVYLLPDGKYASKSDVYKREWNTDTIKPEHIIDADTVDYVPRYAEGIANGIEGEDYVVCKICGFKKGSITQHLRKEHGLTKEAYQDKYHGEVHSKKAKEAFHQCSLNKWKTQFETGKSKKATPKERVENPLNKERNDITYEILEKLQNEGKSQVELQQILGCSEPTLYKWMENVGYTPISKTLCSIKKAVFDGAELNLEEMTQEKLDELYKTNSKDVLMKKFGVKRTVFETWLKSKNLVLRKVKDEYLFSDYEYEPGLQRNEKIEEDEISDRLLKKIKDCGFPYYNQKEFDVGAEIKKVKESSNIIIDNHVKNSSGTSGGGFLLSYFPNFFDVRRDKTCSAKQIFDSKLRHVVRDTIRHYDKLTVGTLRTEIKAQQRVTGFRAILAKQIYDRYCPKDGCVLDPCGGWGGRMLGAYCSDNVSGYECIDASKKTVDGLNNLKKDLEKQEGHKILKVNFGTIEDFASEKEYDVIFTSPPYFSKEHYSEDESQSFIRYKDYDSWRCGFLGKLVEQSHRYLKNYGFFIINIDDVNINGKNYPLKNDFIELCNGKFVVVDTIYMDYSNRFTGEVHFEPIYVLRKV